ncbi:MAG: branched-chain amino acid ABC transporter permease [Chloroflexota bacterium]|nr:branched-chain amino acid ABC transporter permease [Chloroflexota bacterium]
MSANEVRSTDTAIATSEGAGLGRRRVAPGRSGLAALGGAALASLALAAFGFTQPADSYLLLTGFLFFLFASQSLAWNLIGGYGGQTSFGHATFYGIGAYATALLSTRAGWPVPLAMLAGALGAAAFSLLWGYPLFRLRGFYFAIATIGIGEATRLIALTPLRNLTGGASGYRMPTANTPDRLAQYLAALGLLLATFLVSYWVRNSALGLGLFALNMDSDAAETLGVDTTRLKAIALALSACIVGLTGGFYAWSFRYINPSNIFGFAISIAIVLMAVIGGIGTIIGPLLGAIVYVVIQDQIGATEVALGGRTILLRDFQTGIYGLLLALIILFEPAGLVGLFRRLGRLFRRGRGPVDREAAVQGALLHGEEG